MRRKDLQSHRCLHPSTHRATWLMTQCVISCWLCVGGVWKDGAIHNLNTPICHVSTYINHPIERLYVYVYSFVGHQTITGIGGVYGSQVAIRVLTHLSIIGLYVYMNHPFLCFTYTYVVHNNKLKNSAISIYIYTKI